MKRSYKIFCVLAALLLVISLFMMPVSAIADAGNFAGDTDWGDSGWDSGSDWDSDWGSDDDYYYDDSYSSSSDDLFFLIPALIGADSSFEAIIIIAIILFIILRRRNKKKQAAPVRVPDKPDADLTALMAKDPNFSEQLLMEKVGNWYIKLQNAWQDKDLAPVRSFMTDTLYTQYDRQLDELRRREYTNYVERIAVLNAQITNYQQEGENDVLYVRLDTRICDYTTDKDGNVVSGDKDRELFMAYEWKLIRSANAQTKEKEELSAVNCPNCGAPLSINQSGQCEYCGTTIELAEHDWALSQIRGISQRTGN